MRLAPNSSVFERINEKSQDVWKWEMYRLIDEFDRRPALPPPLSFVVEIMEHFGGKTSWSQGGHN